MTVKQLIEILNEMPKDKVVILTESDGIGWDNVGKVYEDGSSVKISMSDGSPFD